VRRSGFGEPLRQMRERRQLTQQEVADELAKLAWGQRKTNVGVDRQMVSKWEREKKFPEPLYRELLCLLYGTTPEVLGFRASSAIVTSVTPETASDLPQRVRQLESPLDIAERTQSLTATNIRNETLDQFDEFVELIVSEYETMGPAQLTSRVIRQRKRVDELLNGHQLPRQRERLYRTAAKLSGLLGYMAVNLGQFPVAKAYCMEAFQLGDVVEDRDVQAWVRGTQSFCAYYVRDYRRALDLARDGQRYAKAGPQAVRLAINGEARALAKLGDRTGVDEAVERAYRLSDKFDAVSGVSPCISFGLYSLARTASNAATAYVALREPERVREYADQVMPVFELSQSCWSQSLLRLDLANALVVADQPEPEEAARLVTEALMISAERPITSVLTRTHEFLEASTRWRNLPAVATVAETLHVAELR
jgi:transcriptional regulator with XRE-family HTH domain